MKQFLNVDEFIENSPDEIRDKLQKLREIIKSTFPDAVEGISYGMPSYKLNGRPLAYFANAKKHIGLYIPPPIVEDFSDDLKNYGTTKSAIHLPLNKDYPVGLIQRMLRARAQINDRLNTGKS